MSHSSPTARTTSRCLGSEPTELAEARSLLAQAYDVVDHQVRICNSTFTILGVCDTYALLDRISPEEFQRDERLPYWGDMWPSSIALARWCLKEGQLKGKRILELGCGLGLAGISAARAGAIVVMSDYEEDALAFANYNVRANGPTTDQISCYFMDWRSPETIPECDIIVGSDVVYEEKNIEPIVQILQTARIQYSVFTDPQRRTCGKFINALQQRGFLVESHSSNVILKGPPTTVMLHVVRSGDSRGTS